MRKLLLPIRSRKISASIWPARSDPPAISVPKTYAAENRLPLWSIWSDLLSQRLVSWDIFGIVAVYPRTVRMLQQVVAMSPHANDVMFAAALLPILALSEDGGVSDGAKPALRLVQSKVSGAPVSALSAYAFQREMLRSLAESGDRRSGAGLVDYVAKQGGTTLETRFLTRYGWPAESVRGNIERKLSRPTRRDENLRPLYEAMGDLLVS